MKKKTFLLLLTIAVLILAVPNVWANGDRSKDLVAPYAHFAFSAPPATGPFTTHFLISNMRGNAITVNVKCYSDISAQRLGPAAGTTFNLASHGIAWADPASLGLVSDPNFSGYGWCYFAGSDYFSVGFVTGASVGGTLITNNNARAVMSSNAQHHISTQFGGIPYWTSEGSWESYLLLVNPTTSIRSITVNAYNSSGTLVGTWTTTLQPRDLDMGKLAQLIGNPAFTGWGNADITVADRGFMGWTAALNFNSFQAFITPVTLSDFWLSELGAADRP